MSRNKKSSTIITLSVNPTILDNQYGFEKSPPVSKITKISDLCNKDLQLTNDLKDNYTVKISSLHFIKKKFCFWDRNEFSNHPVYCPIKQKKSVDIKEYVSTINGKPYKIQDTINTENNEEFFVDGVFCSLECCMAFIIENSNQIFYRDSEMLLKYIYNTHKINSAHHWRLLEQYGGNMTIEQFRKSCSNISYEQDGIFFIPIVYSYKEQYHL